MIELPSPCLVVLVGPAGSGKSTWANEHVAGCVVSSDSLRMLVGEGDHDLRASADAFAVLDDVVARRMKRRLTTVIDTLGTDPDRRASWRALASKHRMPCVAVLFDIVPSQLRRQNKARVKRVPDEIIRHQLAEWPAVCAAVRAEPFDGVHTVAPAALVPTSLISRQPDGDIRPTLRKGAAVATPDPDREVQFGLHIPRFDLPGGPTELGAQLRLIVTAAELAGFDSLWVMDHFRQIPTMGPPWTDMLESWTTLAYLAAATEQIRLGTLVTGVTYRNVAHLAKIVATLDVLSHGRVICGLGLGWFADEHHAYGWRFPTVAERYALVEDALQLLPQMWGPGNKPFHGRVLHVPDTSCYPRPLQAHVPVVLGGSGERRTLPLAARYADGCNLFGDPETVARRVQLLRDHCAAIGRDPTTISVTHLSTVLLGDDAAHVRGLVDATRPPKVSAERHARLVNAGTLAQHARRIDRLREAGVDHIIVSLADLGQPDSVERYGRLIALCGVSR